MDTGLTEMLIRRAETMLPAATMMLLECAADSTGGPDLYALLAELQQKGLAGEALCTQPYESVVFSDRVLLRCRGCPRAAELPRIAGIGYGATKEEARQNALYALTLPMDKRTARQAGCLAAQQHGQGPVRVTETACIINRAAYAKVTA